MSGMALLLHQYAYMYIGPGCSDNHRLTQLKPVTNLILVVFILCYLCMAIVYSIS